MRNSATRPLPRVCKESEFVDIRDRTFWSKPKAILAADGTVLRTWRDLERWLAGEFFRRFPSAQKR